MELSDIKPSLSEMSDEELREMLMSIRQNRRISKANPTKEKKAAKPRVAKKAPEASLEQLLATMSPEQLAAAIAQLGGTK